MVDREGLTNHGNVTESRGGRCRNAGAVLMRGSPISTSGWSAPSAGARRQISALGTNNAPTVQPSRAARALGAGGFLSPGTAQRSLPVAGYTVIESTRRTNRGRETMRDDPWTAANSDKEQQKVTIPPKRKPMAETASPPSTPTVSGPFWTGKKSAPDVPKLQGGRRRTTTNR